MEKTTINFLIVLTVGCALTNGIILYTFNESSLDQNRSYLITSNWTINSSAALATSFSIVIVARQKFNGLHGRTYSFLLIGLSLWLAAELFWTYNEVNLGIENPFPSYADILWLGGYPFFAYHLFSTFTFFKKAFDKRVIVLISLLSMAVLAYLIFALLGFASDDVLTTAGILSLIVSIAYPVLDFVLLVPSLIILTGFAAGRFTFPPWMFISLSLAVFSVADIAFALMTLGDSLPSWISSISYNTSYLLMASALYWYNKHFILDQKRIEKTWQQENR